MNIHFRRALITLAFTVTCTGAARGQTAPDDGLVVVSGPASPRVAYTLSRDNDTLTLTVAVESFAPTGGDSTVQVGLAADKTVRLSNKGARAMRIVRSGNTDRYEFRVPAEWLVNSEAGWQLLRLGFEVSWEGGPFGQARQRESFLQSSARAAHGGLSSNPTDWQPISLAEFERAAADRRLQIAFDYNQPLDGKATVVIEEAQGRRVRNLISGRAMAKGTQRIVWDGRDDQGRAMPPGNYRWRAIAHPGLKPNYLFSYANGPGSNHGTLHAATTNGASLFFGTSVSEGGYELVQLAQDGTFQRGFNAPHGHGLGRVAVAADEKFLYAAYDGTAWGQSTDRSKPDWKVENQISLVRFDLATGNLSDFSRTARFATLRRYVVGPGSPDKRPDRLALAGLAFLNGRLYLADGGSNEVLDIDPATGAIARSFSLENSVALTSGNGLLYAIAGGQLLQIAPATGQSKAIASLTGQPAGLAIGDGKFYVSDAEAHVVQVLDERGKIIGTVGKPGGIAPGAYDPLRLHNPAGLVLAPDGHLWVTENNRWQPKRLAAYDPRTPAMWKEFFGPAAYGAPGAGFDPLDATRWIGQNTLFQLDFAAKTAKPLAIMGGEDGAHYRFWRQDGRTFLITYGKAIFIQELRADGTTRPLACLSSAHQFSYSRDWRPPAAFVEAFNRDYPAQKYVVAVPGRPNHGFGMLWVDKNGDAAMQAEEIEFATAADSLAGSGWGHDFNDLTLRVAATVGGKGALVTLRPNGWWPGGAPRYPALNDAVKASVPVDLPAGSNSAESTVDRFGNLLLNADPTMRAFSPDGKLLWTYPNQWSGVHGSHKAPLPSPGELQGVLFFTGVAPLDDRADVVVMNGNHGRAFVMTTDGLYLDEMFSDVRLMTNPQAGGVGILGGECFGGTFGRSEKDGNYYFQGGGIEYRLYRVDGLRQTTRAGGPLVVTPQQAIAAERNSARTLAAEAPARRTRIAFRATPPIIDGRSDDWTGEAEVQWDRNGQFPVAVRAAHDGKMLYLHYTVRGDASPWVNNGKDWQQLFKTGDGVDLQLGTNVAANPARSGPVAGDLRLFVAPFAGQSSAILYRHRLPGAADSVVFQSPWRSEKVDSVKKLETARVAVTRGGDSYVVEIAVPLAELGLNALSAKPLRGDFGVIYGDAAGTVNIFRNYWANPATGLVNDVPGEIILTPNLWGDVVFEEVTP